MKWFDRWFYRKARWAWHRAGVEYPGLKAEQDRLDELGSKMGIRECYPVERDVAEYTTAADNGTVDMGNSIRFNVLPCNGGLVLEVRVYDRKTHENIVKTYLIPEGEPVAERIGQYVTMEMMQR